MRGLVAEAWKVQLVVQLFNMINCWYLQLMKWGFLISTILHGYVGIRLRQNNVLIAAYGATVYIIITVIYCGTFHKAYRLQELQKKLKRELKAECGKLSQGSMVRKENFKAVNALSCPGLKVGQFHEMERQSALIFIDFVHTQIISLLVSV